MPSKTWRKTDKKKKAVKLPNTKPGKNTDWRFKQVNSYRVKPEPFPRVLYTKMKFSDARRLTASTATLAASHTYRVNSIYDPDYTGTGSTVVGWQQMDNLYGRYMVTGCKINVSFLNPAASGTRVGIRLRINSQGACAGETTQALAEQPLTYMNGISDNGSQKKNYSMFVRPWTLMGISKLEYFANTSRYSSVMNDNPNGSPGTATKGGAFFDVFAVNPDTLLPASDTRVDVVVRLVFYVQLYERKYLASSSV